MPEKKKRRRKVPRNIGEKTDREIMERVFGKRIMHKVDAVLAEQNNDNTQVKEK